MNENSNSTPYFWFDYDQIQNDMFVDKKCFLHRTELATKMGGVFELITFPCDVCGFKPLNYEDIISHIAVCKPQPYVVKLDHKVSYDANNRMLLDVGVSSTKVTDEDYVNPSDAFIPYDDINYDDYENVLDEYIEVDNNNETSVNFNADVSKIAINDILNEMRMVSPIENDLFNDRFSDEANNNTLPFGDGSLEGSMHQNTCCNMTQNQNYDFKEQNDERPTTNNDMLDQLLNSDECSTSDVQVDFNETVPFNYDTAEQFNEPDITLTYPEEPESATVQFEDNSLNFNADIGNNYECKNQLSVEFESYLKKTEPGSNSATNNNAISSNKQYFECSTNLPMTPEELQDDIKKYVITEQNNSCPSYYDYSDMTSDPANNQDTFYYPYSTEMLPDHISEQNMLFQSLDSVNPIVSLETPNIPLGELATTEEYQTPQQPAQNYQCNCCSFYTDNSDGYNVHMQMHSDAHLSSTGCQFTPGKAQNLRQHHGTAYGCQTCDYVTYSNSKLKSHMRREH